MQELFEDVWGDQKQIVLDHALHLPTMVCSKHFSGSGTVVNFCFSQIALFVIGAAGFGKKMSWKDTTAPPPGHKMNFKVLNNHAL